MTFTPASLAGIIVGILGPILVARWLYLVPKSHNLLLGLLAFSTCHIKKPFYQEIFYVLYRGVDRGFGVTVTDVLTFGFALYLIFGGKRRDLNWWPYNSFLWWLVITISLFSLIECSVAYYGLFTVQKFFRAIVLYWVIVNAVRTKEEIWAILVGLMFAVIFQGGVVFFDKYITKAVVNRSVGSFPHPNTLAMYVDLIAPIFIALLFSNTFPHKRWVKFGLMAIALAAVSVVFSKSRASLVIMAGFFIATAFVSFISSPNWRKSKLILTGMIFGTIFAAIMAPRIIRRFETAPEESADTRIYFNSAAVRMADDHFFGVGLNTFSWNLKSVEEYYWYVYPAEWEAFEERGDYFAAEEFRWSVRGQSRLGTAHHIYLLMAAEIGWLGMWVFIAFLVRFYWINIVLFIKLKDPFFKAISLGILMGTSTLHLQGLLEWIFRQTQVFFLFFIIAGLLTVLMSERKRQILQARYEMKMAKLEQQQQLQPVTVSMKGKYLTR